MFAVPGWSVSSSALKKQTSSRLPEPAKPATAAPADEDGETPKPKSKSSKKRKRGAGANEVTADNLEEMWRKHVEKVKPVKGVDGSGKREERQLVKVDGAAAGASVDMASTKVNGEDEKELNGDSVVKANDEPPKKKTKKEKKREKKQQGQQDNATASTSVTEKPDGSPEPVTTSQPPHQTQPEKKQKNNKPAKPTPPVPTTTVPPPPPPTATAKLTPLQASMRDKLISARFRHLNETLYTKPSEHSLSLFATNPSMFSEYHEGFRRQVEVWPENPVNGYIALIRARGTKRTALGSQKGAFKKEKGSKKGRPAVQAVPEVDDGLVPLPRTSGICTIADLGCGDAALASTLAPEAKKLNVKILSYDLQSPSPLVTKADIASLPLDAGSVDVAVFCLALMGTNWIDFIEEAWRVLRWRGELWIAEIKSRFGRVENKKNHNGRLAHSVGSQKKKGKEDKKPKKKSIEQEEGMQEGDDVVLAEEVDGADVGGKNETDVSAFVEVLRKRGFVLNNQSGAMGVTSTSTVPTPPEGQQGIGTGIDLSNRMFVKLAFVKAATPNRGKCVPKEGEGERGGNGGGRGGKGQTWQPRQKGGLKFIDDELDDTGAVEVERGVLKPCVYKLR